AFPELRGHYVYADYVSGRVWSAPRTAAGLGASAVVAHVLHLSAFGADEEGELHAAGHGSGIVLRIGPPDADGDGISDGFETAHFGSATAADAGADPDGDGLANLQEYFEQRDPLAKDNDVFA